VRTTDAIMDSLAVDEHGLLRRYKTDDGLEGTEGAFVPCSFWLAAVLARQGRAQLARRVFDRAASTASDLGLFSEEYDAEAQRLLGNYPQALTHLSHIEAWRALSGGA
jgi:GH15 family glucan-1,4-alpha-glucosidase